MKRKLSLHILSFLSIALFMMFFLATGGKITQEVLKTPEFNYSGTNTSTEEASKITFALIEPQYNFTLGASDAEPFKSFRSSLNAEILEMLTERGYAVRGPFASIDEMIYTDKENSDLTLSIALKPEMDVSNLWTRYSAGEVQGVKIDDKALSIYGKIELIASEPITKERMWAKSVSIPQKTTRPITSSKVYTGSLTKSNLYAISTLSSVDPNVSNPLTEVFEEIFSETLGKIDKFLEPEEFLRLKAKIEQLKAQN